MKQKFVEWFKRILYGNEEPRIEFTDPKLGEVRSDPSLENNLLMTVSFEGRDIELTLDPDGEELEECLEIARELSASLVEHNKKALSVASRDLLTNYNENWRFYGVSRGDGTTEEIEDPALTPTEFEARLRLTGLSVTGTSVEFWYSDMNLFAGHSIFVDSADGLAFTDVHASLFG